MSRKRPGLGKGLDALIPQDSGFLPQQPSGSGVQEISVEAISPNPRQPRVHFDGDELSDLANSIREHGVIQPLIVTQDNLTGKYILIAGERRLLASKEAGLLAVPVVVRETTEQERLELALIENVQRADLSPLETAEAYRQLTEEFGLSHEAVGQRVGKSRVTVTNTLRLLNLPPSIQQAITDGKISEGHARALLALPSPQSQTAALQTILDKDLNVRQTEELVRRLAGEKTAPAPKKEIAPEITALEERLRAQLGTKVTLKHGRKGGSITIHYFSNEELDSLLDFFEKNG
jgi:ParB family transcriptional regulator, chromosome partitioning protein